MPTQPLPSNSNLDKLRDHAKTVREWVRAGVPGAVDLVREHHPRLAQLRVGSPEAASFRLSDAQLTLARHYDFASWPRLVAHLRLVEQYGRSPHQQAVGAALTNDAGRAEELLRLACLTYGTDDPDRHRQAAALLTAHPHLARASIYTASVVGDSIRAAELLTADPTLARSAGGPFGWEPLVYLTYSRLAPTDPAYDAVATAKVLLAAGADPNDSQTIYNWGLGGLNGDDTAVLELLIEFGFGRGCRFPARHTGWPSAAKTSSTADADDEATAR